MSKFLTLIKRDIADYKGAIIITPLAIAAFVIGMILLSIVTGHLKINGENFSLFNNDEAQINATFSDDNGNQYEITKNADGKFVVQDSDGQQRLLSSVQSDNTGVKSQAIAFASGIGAAIPIAVSSIVVLFLLAGSLYDERKDKSIMFWKSLPISDGQTVVSKMVSIVGVGLGFGFVVSVVLHIFIATVTYFISYGAGLFPLNLASFVFGTLKLWSIGAVGLLVYVLWAFPVYSWIIAASAYAPKAPFLLAFVPLFLLPLVGKIFFNGAGNENLLLEPLVHLSGSEMWKAIGSSVQEANEEILNVDGVIGSMLNSLQQPSLWIGLVIGVALLYAATIIRRKRSF